MEIYCTRPSCPNPVNQFADLDNAATLKTVQQKYCVSCGMPLILAGRYLPERLLGRGGFGSAFLSGDRYTPTMRKCVVKQFQPSGDLTHDQMQIAQDIFEREAQVLEELGTKHPQIPDLFAFFPLIVPSLNPGGPQEEFFYLVQEFIDGEDLEHELERRGRFSQNEVMEVLVSMLKVLAFVHDNNTIHRDIKPSNIMRHRNGTLYLLDFGAVKQVTQQSGKASGKSTGIYSMGFAPPEQMSGGTVYPSTDLYALAVTCIMLLTGKSSNELYDGYNNVWKWEPHAQVYPSLAAVFNRMLQSTPNQRYASAQAVIAALKQAVGGQRSSPAQQSGAAPTSSAGAAPTSTSIQPAQPSSGGAGQAPVQRSPQPPAKSTPAKSTPAATPTLFANVSLPEFLGGAAFTGFEGGLLAIALVSFLGTTVISGGAWLVLMGVLVLLQVRRVIERVDLVILAAVTLGVVLFFASNGLSLINVVIAAAMAGLIMVAIATFFRLLYQLLARIL